METIKDLGTYTFPALLKNSVKKFADSDALSLVNGKPVTYSMLNEKSIEVAKMIAGLGINPGSKIAIFSTSMPQWGTVYFSIVNYGSIAVPLLPDFSPTEVESIFDHCSPDALFVSSALYKKIEPLGKKLPPVIINIEDFTVIKGGKIFTEIQSLKESFLNSLDKALKENSIASLKKGYSKVSLDDFTTVAITEPVIKEDDIASIIYTSGTTGRSKGVELTHKNLVWTAIQCQTVYRVNKLDKCLSFLPLSHVYEFTIGFTMQMLNGACVFYLGKPPTVSALLPAFIKIRPTIVCSVPMIMEKIYKNKVLPEIQKNKFTSAIYKFPPVRKIINKQAGKKIKATFGGRLQFFGIGGAKIDEKIERFMKEAKFPYAIGYGLTETSPLLAGSRPSMTIPGTVGPVLEGVELTLINKNKETGIGEIVAKGANVMKGYYKAPELTAESFTTDSDSCGAGWYKTGDLGTLAKKKGFVRLSLKGRCKNMILGNNGENIYPEDIEFVLNQHPLVSESLVVEGEKGLVAIVHFNEEKVQAEAEKRALTKEQNELSDKEPAAKTMGNVISNTVQNVKDAVTEKARRFHEDVQYQKLVILNEIQYFVNSKVNRGSKIETMESVNDFEKTASQKIKRYLYEKKDSPKDNKKKK